MENLDFIELPAEGVEATMCIRCSVIKPNAQFKRTLTPLQAKARGYANNKPVWYVSSICYECKPYKKRAIQELPKHTLKNLSAIGTIHQAVVELEIDRRKSRVATLAQRTTKKRWVDVRKKAWRPLLQALAQEIIHIRQQHKHIKRTMPDIDDHEFFDTYLHCLLTMRGDFKHRCHHAEPLKYTRWFDYIAYEVMEDLLSKWRGFTNNMPLMYINRMRVPAFAQIMDTRAKQVAPKLTLVRADTKERLKELADKVSASRRPVGYRVNKPLKEKSNGKN